MLDGALGVRSSSLQVREQRFTVERRRPFIWLTCGAALTLAAAAAPAQRTWIVDPQGGGDFTDLPPAVTAASPGDLIIVRRGFVRGSVVNKSLRILTQPTAGMTGDLIVENLSASDVVVLGFFQSDPCCEPQMILRFRNCRGRIHVGDLRFTAAGDPVDTPTFVRIESCASVTFYNCWLIDLFVRDSSVLCHACIVDGDAQPRRTRDFAFPGIDCVDSDITIAQCAVRGGVSFRDPPSIPGIQMQRGVLRITGAGTSLNHVASGSTWNSATGRLESGPAIHSDDGLVEIDPRVVLQTRQPGPPLTTGTSRFVTKTMHFMRGSTWNPQQGDNLEAHVWGPAGATAWTFASLPSQPTPWFLGTLWVDVRFLIPMGSGTIPATGPLSFSAPLGTQSFADGTVFALQSVILDQGRFSLTMPILPILMPPDPP